jgi:Flp pilus assembly protein TadD/mono/diheme cytochrome c family protein
MFTTALVTVLVFTTTDCPISNRYAPEIQRLASRFEGRAYFRLVYPVPTDTDAAIREHVKKFGYRFEWVRDHDQKLVRQTGATVTPEVAVLDAAGTMVYRGRIDDRYIAFGRDRPEPTVRDLERSLDAVLAGKPVPLPRTRAIGCILSDLTQQPEADVTFARDIAPIVFDACVSCHRPGGPGPFSLTTYDDVRRRATQIAQVTQSRFMPPWKVEPGVGQFVGQRQLTDREIALIDRWAKDGTPEGDPKLLPALPASSGGWLLGTPDLVVKPDAPFMLPAQQTDAFRIFAIRVPVKQRTYVTGIEFHPGNARVVHHANIRIDRSGATRTLDAADPLPGYDGLMPRSAEYPEGHFLGWTPGQVAPLVPAELSWPLEPGSDLVVQLHMQPSGAVEEVLPEIGFYFSDRAPSKTPTILRIGSQGIDIPPGEARYVVRDSYELPVDVQLLAIQPHAHYRARDIRGVARLPDGTSRVVMHIKDWDFRWQHVYREQTPIQLPKGTRLSMEYTYDNSADNPRNPELPPARVYWGQRSRDEMGDLWFQLLAGNESDRLKLAGEVGFKMSGEDIVGYETMLKVTPNDAELRDDLALLYLSRGLVSNAVRNFEISAALKPESAAAHFNLGTALAQAGRFNAAVESFRHALTLRPGYSIAHANLGRVLLAQGKSGEAIAHLEQADTLDSKNVPTLLGLADAYAARGEIDRAIEMLDRASRLPLTTEAANEIRAKRQLLVKRRGGPGDLPD